VPSAKFDVPGAVTITIRQLDEKFPEPWFSKLQRAVFSDVQHESAAFAEVVAAERAGAAGVEEPNIAYSPMVRFGAYIDALDGEAAVGDAAQGNDQLVGWSCGWMERRNCFYMANSGVRREHRRAGIYAALLEAVVSHARELGAHMVRSQHSVLNNPVIVCKLRRGFHVSGLNSSAQMGTLVELVLHLSEPRYQLYRSRVVPLVRSRED
jgi:GNAT superfamily N-acetyltransferase